MSAVTVSVGELSVRVLEFNGLRVCTTAQLAQFYGTSEENLTKNYRVNAGRFTAAKHFFKLTGPALKEFGNLYPTDSRVQISPMARSLFLWTERGAARHAKMLTTDKAWEVFEALEDNYFRAPEVVAAEQIAAEYLPGYHEMHELAHELAKESPNERFVHMNLNKLVNRTAGIGAGQRRTAPPARRARLIVAQEAAIAAMAGAPDHHVGYQRARHALEGLAQVLAGPPLQKELSPATAPTVQGSKKTHPRIKRKDQRDEF